MKNVNSHKLAIVIFVSLYLVTRIVALDALPVFADEAIYIRWAQLIIDDWQRYAFFPLNDGKTPLFIWTLVPFQFLFSDQLVAARFVSALFGLLQLFLLGAIIKLISHSKYLYYIGMLLVIILPFWIFHHRMALMDGALTTTLSLTLLALLKTVTSKDIASTTIWRVVAGIALGVSLLIKIPAVVAVPPLFLLLFLSFHDRHTNESMFTKIKERGLTALLTVGIAGSIFFLQKLHPAFGQLFSRGGDFLYPIEEVLFHGIWRVTIGNFPTYLLYFVQYLTPSIFFVLLMGLFSTKNKKETHLFFWAGVLFVLPIALFGKVVYPRYLFPAAIFFTVAAASSFDALISSVSKSEGKRRYIFAALLALLMGNTVSASSQFMVPLLFDTNNIPFVSADREQYLTEWSSGHGIKEVTDLLRVKSEESTIALATEGYFGTLPDGITLYLHRRPVDSIYVEGIGQPISAIPTSFLQRANTFEKQWLVVNSNRLLLDIPSNYLIAEYCRPYDSSCLLLYDITQYLKSNSQQVDSVSE